MLPGPAAVVSWGAGIFSSGLLLALPLLVAALLIANISPRHFARVAPPERRLAVGFPRSPCSSGIVVLQRRCRIWAASARLYEKRLLPLRITVMRAVARGRLNGNWISVCNALLAIAATPRLPPAGTDGVWNPGARACIDDGKTTRSRPQHQFLAPALERLSQATRQPRVPVRAIC